uniref:Uncharacterized protein n=1 Tax=Ciona savignyi TaxID=51511 RepID=H2Y598_CIOSA
MSCVPSINAYVASHSHPSHVEVQEMTETEIVSPPCQPLKPNCENEKKSWLGSIFDKFSFVGHDGVTLIQEAKKNTPDVQQPQESGYMDLLSRVRHLSNSSTESTSTETEDRQRHKSSPDR